MANELSISASLSFTKSGASVTATPGAKAVTVTGTSGVKNVVAIGIVDETLVLGDVTTIGYVFLQNLDATNFIDIGSDGTLYPIRLKAGEFALARWNAAAIHAKADTASCNLQYAIVAD